MKYKAKDTQIETFTSADINDIERSINNFLTSNPDVTVLDISVNPSGTRYMGTVVYAKY